MEVPEALWSGACSGVASCSLQPHANVAAGALFSTVKFGKLKLNKKRGTATLPTRVAQNSSWTPNLNMRDVRICVGVSQAPPYVAFEEMMVLAFNAL